MVEKAGMTDCQVEKPFPHKKFVEICSQAESWRAEACRRAECSFVNLWGFPGCARGKEPACQCTRHKRCWFDLWVRKIPWRRKWLPTPVFWPGEFHGLESPPGLKESTQLNDFHFSGSGGKESACNVGDPDSVPGLRRSPGEWNGNPHQYSCLENPMDRGAWWATVHGITKSQT